MDAEPAPSVSQGSTAIVASYLHSKNENPVNVTASMELTVDETNPTQMKLKLNNLTNYRVHAEFGTNFNLMHATVLTIDKTSGISLIDPTFILENRRDGIETCSVVNYSEVRL